ncbi:Phage X family [Marinobacter salarius]|nr:Phage X family [Marinobacter salarius]VVT01120.1 Phage X family [Marinobacter salarius]VXC34053.1 Phage X family [Marinobacter salarius]
MAENAIIRAMPAQFSMTKDEQLTFLRLPVKLRGTYVTWLMGYNPYFLMSRETYYRHRQDLLSKYGIDIAHRV